MKGLVAIILLSLAAVPLARAQAPTQEPSKGFSSSDIQVLYGWDFQEPGISANVPKNIFTFENTMGWSWGSSYVFVDALRSWSDADLNAKEVYAEWYPSVSLKRLMPKKATAGFVRDLSVTMGINTGVRSNGPAPFVVLPGATFDLKVPGFKFMSVGTFAYIDRGQFQGEPTGCHATTYQVTPSWSLPFNVGGAAISFDGFVDFIGSHAECKAMVISQPQLKLDLSALWHQPAHLYLGVEFDYWHNKYGIQGLSDKVPLPLLVWRF